MENKEIDRLVAEKVMGWDDVWQPFFPSTEIKDAWLVVEKMKDMGLFFNVCPELDACHVDIWVQSDRHQGLNPYRTVHEKTAPLAICKAALAIVGVEVT
ncbi:BC1872 family protein [Bacillus sp. T33-2]|uniref:BC1872 family protein n=1 Tax=Bacillus sp. T33-2 TaxID=2054168 RepID=UPI000C793EE9|nr:hypothetical protein [Bacillus sp. T33-2]PLR93213.1 hypothetical protein CVD19_19610 [Bacillus sp. T33-2]